MRVHFYPSMDPVFYQLCCSLIGNRGHAGRISLFPLNGRDFSPQAPQPGRSHRNICRPALIVGLGAPPSMQTIFVVQVFPCVLYALFGRPRRSPPPPRAEAAPLFSLRRAPAKKRVSATRVRHQRAAPTAEEGPLYCKGYVGFTEYIHNKQSRSTR
jgi:hypothetical protein